MYLRLQCPQIKITFIVFLTVQQGFLYIDVIYAVIMSYHREFLTSIIAGIKIELYFIKTGLVISIRVFPGQEG